LPTCEMRAGIGIPARTGRDQAREPLIIVAKNVRFTGESTKKPCPSRDTAPLGRG